MMNVSERFMPKVSRLHTNCVVKEVENNSTELHSKSSGTVGNSPTANMTAMNFIEFLFCFRQRNYYEHIQE